LVGPLSEVRFGKAAQYYSEAIELSERDTTINLLQKAAIYINSGISSYLSGTDESLVSRSYQVAEKFQEEFGELYPLNSNYILNDIRSSIFFNKAIKLSKSQNKGDKEQAIILFGEYFKISSISSPWLKTGREVYNNLSKEMNYNPDKYAGIIDSSRIDLKKIVGITINDSIRINLSDNSKMVLGQLKDYQSTETVLIPKRNLKRVKISKIGLEMIANEYIFALILNGGHSPAINLSSKSGFEKELKLYVGMKIELLNNILQNMNFKEDVHLTNSRRHYKYYYDIGLGVSLDEIHGTVAELVITNLSDK
jgi:hypothetical protein